MTVDHETIETLSEEPELLAIADALRSAGGRIEAPQPRRARRFPVPVTAVAAAAVAALVLVLVSPWDTGGGPSFMDKALAAVGDQPVLHVALRYSLGDRVDLRTGRTAPVLYYAEVWYDAGRHVYRSVSRMDGRVVWKAAGTGNLSSEPFLLSDLYRQALEQGKVRKTGQATIRGREAIVIEAPEPGGGSVRAYLDADSYQLLRMQFLRAGAVLSQIDVLLYETVSREDAHLPKPKPGPVRFGTSSSGSVFSGGLSSGTLTAAQARAAFASPALWPGRSVDGHALKSIQLETETAERQGRTAKGRTLVFDYGPYANLGSDAYLEIDEAPTTSPLRKVDAVNAPPPGYVDLTSGETSTDGKNTRTQWNGVMQQDGFVLQLTSYSRDTLLAAARAMRPLP